MEGYEVCYSHRPDLADERRRNASKGGKRGGRGRGPSETSVIKGEIRELVEQVRAGEVSARDAAVLGQLYNTILRAIETEGRLISRFEVRAEEFAYETQRMARILTERIEDKQTLDAIVKDINELVEEVACPRCNAERQAAPRRRYP